MPQITLYPLECLSHIHMSPQVKCNTLYLYYTDYYEQFQHLSMLTAQMS